MKTFCTIIIIMCSSCFTNADSAIKSIVKFGSGMVTAYAIHEAGHATTAYLTGTDLKWEIGTYNQVVGFRENASNDTSGALLHASGLVTQAIASEIILQSDIDKNDNFVRGMMAWNIINPLIYSLDYWIIRRASQEYGNYYQGDIEGFEHYTNDTSANVFAGTMTAIAIFQGYRFIKTQNWAPNWMKEKNINLNCQLKNDNAFEMAIIINF